MLTEKPYRVLLVLTILVLLAVAATATVVLFRWSRLEDARPTGALYLEIEADTAAAGEDIALTACTQSASTAVLAIRACDAPPAGIAFATPSGRVTVSAEGGSARIRMVSGAEQSVVCPPTLDHAQPVWRLCVARRSQ